MPKEKDEKKTIQYSFSLYLNNPQDREIIEFLDKLDRVHRGKVLRFWVSKIFNQGRAEPVRKSSSEVADSEFASKNTEQSKEKSVEKEKILKVFGNLPR